MTATEHQSSYLWTKHFPKYLYAVLAFLSQKGSGAEVSEIKERFKSEISNPVINDILTGLDIQNFIVKKDMKDRRRKLVVLTKKGEDLIQNLERLSEIM